MSMSRLWFVRRGAQQRGPFPAALIERNIALGRILPTDELSHDGEAWTAATHYPDFDLLKQEPRPRAYEERQHERRAQRAALAAVGSTQRADERRRQEDPAELARREKTYQTWQGLAAKRQLSQSAVLLILILAVPLFVAAWYFNSHATREVVDCSEQARPAVTWRGCEMPGRNLPAAKLKSANIDGANLREAQLSNGDLEAAHLRYANLSQATLTQATLRTADLTGATLRGADLSHADLRGANLSFADLTDANLEQAEMSGAGA